MSYSMIHVDKVEASGPGGAVRFVRRVLGVEAFGINWFELGPNVVGHEHDETGSGQEEVNIVVRGSGVYRVLVLVDDQVAAAKVADSNGGVCADVPPPAVTASRSPALGV